MQSGCLCGVNAPREHHGIVPGSEPREEEPGKTGAMKPTPPNPKPLHLTRASAALEAQL